MYLIAVSAGLHKQVPDTVSPNKKNVNPDLSIQKLEGTWKGQENIALQMNDII